MTAIVIPNTFLPSTTISSTAMNQNFTEVADAIIASLALDGTDTMTGVLKLANGSAAAPSLTFGSDTNLGIYRKTTDELGFATAGVLAAHIDAAGKMWIATDLDVADDVNITGDLTVSLITSPFNLGAADTTIARSGAGDMSIEGNVVYRAGGTDVAIADGGTGASTAANAFTALKQAASDTDTGVVEIAVKSEMEAASSTLLAVTPGRQQHHPAHPKAWANFDQQGTHNIAESYGVTSISDGGTGISLITWSTAFAAATYGWTGNSRDNSGDGDFFLGAYDLGAGGTKSTTQLNVVTCNAAGGEDDSPEVTVVGIGAQ